MASRPSRTHVPYRQRDSPHSGDYGDGWVRCYLDLRFLLTAPERWFFLELVYLDRHPGIVREDSGWFLCAENLLAPLGYPPRTQERLVAALAGKGLVEVTGRGKDKRRWVRLRHDAILTEVAKGKIEKVKRLAEFGAAKNGGTKTPGAAKNGGTGAAKNGGLSKRGRE